MLQLLRQFRCRLAGALGVLVGSTWLMLAIAPCVAAAEMDMADHCPHCAEVELPCATVENSDCDLPQALAPAQDYKLKQPALVECHETTVAARRGSGIERAPPVAATGPPHPPYTQLFCSYQE